MFCKRIDEQADKLHKQRNKKKRQKDKNVLFCRIKDGRTDQLTNEETKRKDRKKDKNVVFCKRIDEQIDQLHKQRN